MTKLTNDEASNIYGGIAFIAIANLLANLAISITAIIKMANSNGGSIKQNGINSEYKWQNDGFAKQNQSPAFYGY